MAAQNQATTYARVVRLKGDPNRVQETITVWTQHILPLLKKQRGFTGVTLVGNRKSGDALSVSYWDTEATMKEARGQVRPQALKCLLGSAPVSSRTMSAKSRCWSASSHRWRARGRV